MRISDWSSDVCSSDLGQPPIAQKARHPRPRLAQEDASLDRRILRQDSFGLALIPRVEEGETSLGAKPASAEHLALFVQGVPVEAVITQTLILHGPAGFPSWPGPKGDRATSSDENTSEIQS